MMLPILISALLAPGSYFAGAAAGAGAAAPLLRSATMTPSCGAGSLAAIKVALASVSCFVCIAPGVAATLSMANAIVGMIFMRASQKAAVATIARPLPYGSVLVWFASC